MELFDKQETILRNFIIKPNINLKINDLHILNRDIDENRILNIPKCPASTTLKAKRDYFTGEVVDFIEVTLNDAGATSRNSMSFKRAPGPQEEIRGNSMNFPFWPGGFDYDTTKSELDMDFKVVDFDKELLTDELLTVAPGFKSGYIFDNNSKDLEQNLPSINLIDTLEDGLDVNEWLEIVKKDDEKDINLNKKDVKLNETDSIDDSILNTDSMQILKISECRTNTNEFETTEWAEMVDISQPVLDFKEKIPEPAMTFPFELDTFQKQAILKLEEKKYVFVAAHTSAGKTVVAEYAIALSQNHMTRAIYTSPIKALSNQKYRDFKLKFRDVGLVTGDIQIDTQSSCLIMTTEILRSMLFGGSDITRDMEYVIFDEVHYINDADRGHVWEEVIMLLPDHVQIIMLSATVPNTQELANWVGNIKKKKVYVISTLKRPVPLVHYLYTGCGGKSRDDLFLIVDAQGKFIKENFDEAKKVKDNRESKSGKIYKTGPKQEQTRWVGLIDHLKRNNNLPVIAFTLSRNRCDKNVAALESIDLNTAREKSSVQKFFGQCLDRLKPDDRVLRQVKIMKSALERGIGVHHSGILPILKEIVEMLFLKGLVKILFATETFAMGVNMPARTVIFDSHFKYDGIEIRDLKSSEYTQMAGRAGRRGHDKNGTVIMLCKRAIPDENSLKSIILGRAEPLQSKFLLRYAVILTCLRVGRIKVEDILMQSFKEYSIKCMKPENEQKQKIAEKELSELKVVDESNKKLSDFFDIADKYLEEKEQIMRILLSQPSNFRDLKQGKILIITSGYHYNKLGILLSTKIQTSKETTFKVLVLDHQSKSNHDTKTDVKWHKMLSLLNSNKFFSPEGVGGHCVVDIKINDIVEITKSNIKVDADLIIKNCEQRQIERFRDSTPGPTVQKAVGELNLLNENYVKNPKSIQIIDLTKKEINIDSDSDISMLMKSFGKTKEEFENILPYTSMANFDTEFELIFKRKLLEKEIEILKFKNSHKNLSLYPDYCDKLNVLRELKYIDENDEVKYKGKVASEMGQNELLITELILCNVFDDLDSAEIAALLSSLVFQAKTDSVAKVLTKKIEKCKQIFEEVSDKITSQEVKYKVCSEKAENLNFGLMEVVYHWAKNKPFSEIIELTDIQEGIIVRCIQQLDETIQDVKTAATRVGNTTLKSKMEDASKAIKRDIVFAASLYTAL